jgi:hypothetical protein
MKNKNAYAVVIDILSEAMAELSNFKARTPWWHFIRRFRTRWPITVLQMVREKLEPISCQIQREIYMARHMY